MFQKDYNLPEEIFNKIAQIKDIFPRADNIEDNQVMVKNEYLGCCVQKLDENHSYITGIVEQVICVNHSKREYHVFFQDAQLTCRLERISEKEVEDNHYQIKYGTLC